MPITLITGPANAGKAKAVLDAVARHVSRGEQPVLVVPTGADADRYRQELAREGPIAGVSVSVFAGLLERVARCAAADEQELGRPPLSTLAREQVLCALAAKMQSSPGGPRRLARALSGAIAELQAADVSPAQLRASLGAGPEGQIELRARMLVELHERYSAVLARNGLLDAELRARRALDVLRRRPSLWRAGAGPQPVLLYGFDDLTSLEMDTVETIGIAVDAHVTVALAYEAGRVAFAGRAWAFQELAPRAAEHVALGPRRDYYAAASRAALHHLERRLFEEEDNGGAGTANGGAGTAIGGAGTAIGGAGPALAGEQLSLTESCQQSDGGESEHGLDVSAAECIRLLPAGSPQEEAALIAGQARALIQDGISPPEIAIVHRAPASVADHLAQALDAAGVPHGIASRARFADAALGRALTGLFACGCEGVEGRGAASLADLLAWLRAPGLLEREHLADRLEARARQAGVRDAAGARRIWERDGWTLDAIDRVREAAGRGSVSLLECARRELMRLFTVPRAGVAEVLDLRRQEAALAVQAGMKAIAELLELAALDTALLGGVQGVLDALASVELPRPNVPREAGVALLDPLALRARRVRVLFACGLQEGVFPAASRADPILSEEMRARLASICGPRAGRRQDPLAAERYLLYATVSRPEERLYLSWHESGQGGAASAPSLFLDDVCDLFGPHLRGPRPGGGPVQAEHEWTRVGAQEEQGAGEQAPRGAGLAGATGVSGTAGGWTQRLMPELRERELWSASSLERWSACPASWLIERLLRAQDLEPEPEPLARGSLAHAVLGDVFEGLREQTGSARLTAASLQTARRLMAQALERREPDRPLTVAQERLPIARRRLEVDLDRYLQHAAQQSNPLEPTHIELSFGFPDEPGSLPALKLADGVLLRGRIDRVDVGPGGQAVVYDYKTGRIGSGHSGVKWLQSGHFQMALYMRVVGELLGLDVVAGLYQPLGGSDLRPRGLLDGDAGLEIARVRTDICDRERIDELVSEVCESAVQAARQAQAGQIEARPATCSYAGGCMHPTICRCRC